MDAVSASTIETVAPRDLRIGEAVLVDLGQGRQVPRLIHYLGLRRAARQKSRSDAPRLTTEVLVGFTQPNVLFANLLQPVHTCWSGVPLALSEIDLPTAARKHAETSHFKRFRIDRSQRALKNPSPGTKAQLERKYDYLALRSCFQFLHPGKPVTIEDRRGVAHDEIVAIGVGYRGPLAITLRERPDHWVDLTQARITFNDKPDGGPDDRRPARPSVTVDCLQELVIN